MRWVAWVLVLVPGCITPPGADGTAMAIEDLYPAEGWMVGDYHAQRTDTATSDRFPTFKAGDSHHFVGRDNRTVVWGAHADVGEEERRIQVKLQGSVGRFSVVGFPTGNVYVDGEGTGSPDWNATFEFTLQPGTHRVRFLAYPDPLLQQPVSVQFAWSAAHDGPGRP